MTEAEWLACEEPSPMQEFLRGRMSRRKLRLLNCAIVRLVPIGLGGETMWELISNRPWFRPRAWRYEVSADGEVVQTQELITLSCHEAIEIEERAADTPGLEAILASAASATLRARYDAEGEMLSGPVDQPFTPTSEYDYRVTQSFVIQAPASEEIIDWIIPDAVRFRLPLSAECHPAICSLSRDIFGNPFRPVSFDAAWRTGTAVAVARGMYESRDFTVMPILADALQDAGCDSDDILNHCRDPHATHVRGCWVVDLVLGKS
jgi:hypothetical protein